MSIAAGGAAKTLMAVTVSLHPGAAQAPGRYAVVQPGDTLSSVSQHEYGTAADWPALWQANRRQVPDPSMIRPGQRLLVPSHPQVSVRLIRAAQAAIPAPPPAAAPAPAPRPATTATVTSDAPATATAASAPAQAAASYGGTPGSFQSCVIQAESSGNPSAVNPASGAGGLYGFLPSTWQALGFPGLPENASVAEQNAAFAKQYAQSGTSAWAPYDGC
ncbi:MAG TPA: transglycosylase family protein [Streptosporangiaceae bacterium]|nr:transglycosylase family protein [Streptosporangiaceae bacterium]